MTYFNYKKYHFNLKKIKTVFHGLLIPFHNKNYLAKITEGSIYTSYIYKFYPNIAKKLNYKMYWNNIFIKYNINHPKIIATSLDNKIVKYNKYSNNKYYIAKPNNGICGEDVKKVKGNEIIKYLKKNKDTIVQELLLDCIVKKARHFRIVSLHNGNIFTIIELKNNDPNEVASNFSNGGLAKICKFNQCNHLSKNEQKSLNDIIIKLKKLHKNEFNFIFSFGWDVMFNCNNLNNIKSYCLEGNIFHSSWFYPNLCNDKMINYYKKECKKFLISRKFIY